MDDWGVTGGSKWGWELGREFLKIRGGEGVIREMARSAEVMRDQADQVTDGISVEAKGGESRGDSLDPQERGTLKDQVEGSGGPGWLFGFLARLNRS